uniref:Uncharacterized protein n=1 Tax=Arundo donax TaxID=35708 RepID=A0A0A9GK12_ARUDO
MVRSSPDDGRRTDAKARKKPKLEARISCAKIVAAVNVTGRHSDLEDKRTAPLTSMQSSEGYGHLGDGGADGQNQHALENLDCVHQTEEDSTKTGGDLSPTMDVDTTKPTDSEP